MAAGCSKAEQAILACRMHECHVNVGAGCRRTRRLPYPRAIKKRICDSSRVRLRLPVSDIELAVARGCMNNSRNITLLCLGEKRRKATPHCLLGSQQLQACSAPGMRVRRPNFLGCATWQMSGVETTTVKASCGPCNGAHGRSKMLCKAVKIKGRIPKGSSAFC